MALWKGRQLAPFLHLLYSRTNTGKGGNAMKYNRVSGDSHIDLTWLPGDLFVDNAPAHLRDAVPQVVDTEAGPRWMAEGTELGVAGGLGFGFTAPRRGLRCPHRQDV